MPKNMCNIFEKQDKAAYDYLLKLKTIIAWNVNRAFE